MAGSPPNSASPVRDPRGPLRGREPPSSARAEPEPAPRRQPHRVAYHLIERLIGFDRPTALLGAASSVSRLPSALGDGGPDRRFAPDLKPEQYSSLVGSARRRWLLRIVRNGDGEDRDEPTRASSRAHTA